MQQDAFRGRRGSITLIRYTDSPIGGDASLRLHLIDPTTHSDTDIQVHLMSCQYPPESSQTHLRILHTVLPVHMSRAFQRS